VGVAGKADALVLTLERRLAQAACPGRRGARFSM
jgi:hypothetical protein